ncbi:C-type lectin domain family 17, member A-like [Mytilus trossulus]|uniref:C-type lectin domain family 17, member A-like n=1 Tax=Mytilus trossulus TaxID=6551 RepID=UPI003007C8D0
MACMEMYEMENSSDELREDKGNDNKSRLWRKQWFKTVLFTLAMSLLSAVFLLTVIHFAVGVQLQHQFDSQDTKLAVLLTQIKFNTKLLSNISCENGWELYKKHCYKFEEKTETRKKAQEKCSKENASLVKIDDADENSFIYSAGGSPDIRVMVEWRDVYWTSGIRINENNWMWTADGTHVTYDNFDSNEPNNNNGIEDCIIVRNDGTWNDYICNRTLYYICEKRA